MELTRAYLERIERFNPTLNAYVLMTPELALEQAKAADAANIGYPLRGVPTSIKDLVSLRGTRSPWAPGPSRIRRCLLISFRWPD